MNTQQQTNEHKTILIHGTEKQFVENLAHTIKKSPHRDNFTVVTISTEEELRDTLENRIDIDLVLLEIEYDFEQRMYDAESPEMEIIMMIRETQQPHTRIVVYTTSVGVVNAQRGDFAHKIPARDRFLKGYEDDHIPGHENDFQRKLKDWLGAL